MSDPIKFKPLPPKEAIEFFEAKGYKIGFDWRDVEKAEHAYSFTVAKAMRNDILQDIRTAMDMAIKDGITYKSFAKDLTPTLQEKGWWGKKLVVDPKTGEEKLVQLGSPRRLKTIYDTNLRSAYSAGAWERIQRVKKTRPYLRYIGSPSKNRRKDHEKFYNIVLPVDHPFWQKFYPPNGWECKCSVQQLSERDLKRLGLKVTEDIPSTPSRTVLNKRTGELQNIPVGIDAGFDFNIGEARMKALTPPPLNKGLNIPYTGNAAKLVFPESRPLSKDIIYPDGLDEREYVDKFMKEFGSKKGEAVVFKDATGEQIIISDDLFKNPKGKLKVTKRMRHRHLGLLARTIKDPDEIWWTWEEYPKGRSTLLRRYMAKWDIEGEDQLGFVLFDVSPDGWTGVTAMKPDKVQSYLKSQRKGALAYRRKQ